MMYSAITSLTKKNRYLTEIARVVFFAGLSLALGRVTEIEGGISNFRELPLLVYVYYLKFPGFLLLTAIISSIPTTAESSFIQNFFIHFPGLVAAWGCYYFLNRSKINAINKGIIWVFFTFLYYTAFLLPAWTFTVLDGNSDSFRNIYFGGIRYIRFEMIATAFISGLYLVQKEIRHNLVQHKKDLEKVVKERTDELAEANESLLSLNEELIANSEQIKLTNTNLDELVKKRSVKIADQLKILNMYADMNAHNVRGPLARILGLCNLIKIENGDATQKKLLLDKLHLSAEELDTIVKEMNRILERETIPK